MQTCEDTCTWYDRTGIQVLYSPDDGISEISEDSPYNKS